MKIKFSLFFAPILLLLFSLNCGKKNDQKVYKQFDTIESSSNNNQKDAISPEQGGNGFEKIGNIIYTVIGTIVSCAFLYGIEGVRYSDKLLKFEGTQSFTEMLNIFGDLFYFSVVVFSTVGFGEILPIGPIGKTLMIFEGLIGGLILAILIIAVYKHLMDR